MESLELAMKIAKILDDRKARDLQVIKIEELTVIADYFVIATGTSTTHVGALADEAEFQHVFLEDARGFYALERLWGDAPRVELDFNK